MCTSALYQWIPFVYSLLLNHTFSRRLVCHSKVHGSSTALAGPFAYLQHRPRLDLLECGPPGTVDATDAHAYAAHAFRPKELPFASCLIPLIFRPAPSHQLLHSRFVSNGFRVCVAATRSAVSIWGTTIEHAPCHHSGFYHSLRHPSMIWMKILWKCKLRLYPLSDLRFTVLNITHSTSDAKSFSRAARRV
ncbi:hypothetical protein FB451DRAFT_1234634 [Mycena latifolia]|nr:hypothetical protein FB451DRAFT_1234634 [Mycena latifolia]